jgi:anti-sigma B factor antagonist
MGFQPGSSFGIQDDRRNGVARLALRGELDLATAPKLEGHLEQVEQDGVRAVVLDLRDLTFVDSTGLHAFLKARSRAADNGHRFALVGANEQVRKLLQLTATQGILEEQGVRLLASFTQRSPAPRGASVDGDGNQDG